MELSAAAELAKQAANRHATSAEDALDLVPGSARRTPYGWVLQLQSVRYLETGDWRSMLVGQGPTIVLDDGTVHGCGTARPPAEEVRAFEIEQGLPVTPEDPAGPHGWPEEPPVWVGRPRLELLRVLVLTADGLVSARLEPAELGELAEQGPGWLEGRRDATTTPLERIERIRTEGDDRVRVVRRGDSDLKLGFPTSRARDRSFDRLHRHLAPHAPIEPLRRPTRKLLELAGVAALILGFGLGLPWMVESGQIDRTQWLVATVFNAVGPTAFRALGIVGALIVLAVLAVAVAANTPQPGFRVRPAPPP